MQQTIKIFQYFVVHVGRRTQQVISLIFPVSFTPTITNYDSIAQPIKFYVKLDNSFTQLVINDLQCNVQFVIQKSHSERTELIFSI